MKLTHAESQSSINYYAHLYTPGFIIGLRERDFLQSRKAGFTSGPRKR